MTILIIPKLANSGGVRRLTSILIVQVVQNACEAMRNYSEKSSSEPSDPTDTLVLYVPGSGTKKSTHHPRPGIIGKLIHT